MSKKIIPKSFFDKSPRFDKHIDSVGYCVNCGKLNSKENFGLKINPGDWLTLVAHGYVRLIDISCECGSSKAIHDIDIEDYRAWDISK